jgi:hypothetical protein
VLLLTGLAGAVLAGSPAMVQPADHAATGVEESFASFAEDWIGRALARGERDRSAPRAQPGASGLVFTYRQVAEDFETELRPTGRPAAPFVGVIRYTEHTYTCSDVKGTDCTRTSALPLTEVFRFRDGRWGY